MPLNNLNNLNTRIKNLREVAYDVNKMYAATLPGEEFHPDYMKNPENFRILLKSATRLETLLKEYFKQLAKDISAGVDWNVYTTKIMGADSVYTSTIFWQDQETVIQTTFGDTLDGAFTVGASDAQADMGINIGYDATNPSAIQTIRTYLSTLAQQLIDTTTKIVKQSLLRSLGLQEDKQQATARLQALIDNSSRASMIAHTEAVNAYTQGKLAVGRQLVAEGMQLTKTWRDGQSGACRICQGLNTMTVPFADDFIGGYQGPPAHPFCKCNLKQTVLNPNLVGSEVAGWLTGKEGIEYIDGVITAKTDGIVWITTKQGRHIPITEAQYSRYRNAKVAATRLLKGANAYQATFTNKVDAVASKLGLSSEHGPVKILPRAMQKITRDYKYNAQGMKDWNRSVLLTDKYHQMDVGKISEAIKSQFGGVERVKNGLADPGYKKIIFNIKLPYGGTGEIQVTTKAFWDAKIKQGGDALYHDIRIKASGWKDARVKMNALYATADKLSQ